MVVLVAASLTVFLLSLAMWGVWREAVPVVLLWWTFQEEVEAGRSTRLGGNGGARHGAVL